MQSWQRHAARNNADLCDVVCRVNDVATEIDADAWTSRSRSPMLYPDAVTLSPDVRVDELLARIDGSAGCSIKDSFASLDLSGRGFRVLVEAQWLVRPPVHSAAAPVSDEVAWGVVDDANELARWVSGWQRDEAAPAPFDTALLDEETIAFVFARSHDDVLAGALLNRSHSAVGISNFFAPAGQAATGWASCVAIAARLWPQLSIVTYASGVEWELARSHDFEPAGPLRVWQRDG